MSDAPPRPPAPSQRHSPMLEGDCNNNPAGLSLVALIAEDFRTHDRELLNPGFWAVALHRFGNWRMGVRPRLLRGVFTVVYRTLYTCLRLGVGIELPYVVVLGRRLRIWHHGGIFIGARSIGDDVHIRHNTTMGVLHRGEGDYKPVIGNRVDVGPGVAILGGVEVGDDVVIGANSVVVKSVPAHTTVFGVPARPVSLIAARPVPEAAREPRADTTAP